LNIPSLRSEMQLQMEKSNTSLEQKSSLIDTSLKSAAIAEAPLAEEISQSEEAKPLTYLDDGFVFGLEGSGLSRPRGKTSQVVVEGDTTETQPYQVALVSATFATHLLVTLNAVAQLNTLNHGDVPVTLAETAVTLLSTWLLADLGSGILHWSVDNYGNGRTPIFGGLIAAFQGHHSAQWTITERAFFNNVWKLCIPFGIPTVAAIALIAGPSHPIFTLFWVPFCTLEVMSQEFHKWSHMPKKELNAFQKACQNAGLSISPVQHARHHVAPYDGNYCIVSGFWNEYVDSSGFFRKFERFVYERNGVESNSWKLSPKLKEKTLRGEYTL
jgi:hypothetical protein